MLLQGTLCLPTLANSLVRGRVYATAVAVPTAIRNESKRCLCREKSTEHVIYRELNRASYMLTVHLVSALSSPPLFEKLTTALKD